MTLVLSANSLIGDDVKNPQGENLGELKEIMIDTDHGRISYGVVSFGGFFGIGDKLFAVPWSAFSIDTSDKCLVLNVPQDRLKEAEGFDQDNWPNFADRTWGAQVYGHYGQEVYW